jgi:hypothetical protein
MVYNNSYQLLIGMAPFETTYGCKCQTPLYCARGSDIKVQKNDEAYIQEMNEKVEVVRENLRVAQSQKKKLHR